MTQSGRVIIFNLVFEKHIHDFIFERLLELNSFLLLFQVSAFVNYLIILLFAILVHFVNSFNFACLLNVEVSKWILLVLRLVCIPNKITEIFRITIQEFRRLVLIINILEFCFFEMFLNKCVSEG